MGTESASCSSSCRAVCISVKGRCMDILDLVDVGISDGNGCHACDRETVCRIWGQRLDVFKSAGDYCDRFSYVVSGNCEDIAIYCSDMYRCVCCMCCWLWGFISFSGKNGIDCFPSGKVNLIYGEEILFFIFFLMWTYFAGFRPQAYGTEKFMDYGFMEAMMRSTTLPARDLWYSEGTINYYYGGQYFAVFLTKADWQ